MFVNVSELVINKMKEYSHMSDALDIMQRLLEVSHWVPISPDVIPAVPFQTTDPFVINHLPGTCKKLPTPMEVKCQAYSFRRRMVRC